MTETSGKLEPKHWVLIAAVAVVGLWYFTRGGSGSATQAPAALPGGGTAESDSLKGIMAQIAGQLGLAQIQAGYENNRTNAAVESYRIQAASNDRASNNAASVAKNRDTLGAIVSGATIIGTLINTILNRPAGSNPGGGGGGGTGGTIYSGGGYGSGMLGGFNGGGGFSSFA